MRAGQTYVKKVVDTNSDSELEQMQYRMLTSEVEAWNSRTALERGGVDMSSFCRFYCDGVEGQNRYYLIKEYCEGGDLKVYIDEKRTAITEATCLR
jgi:serine/threonine protein kinase